jgi:hypothetical protein
MRPADRSFAAKVRVVQRTNLGLRLHERGRPTGRNFKNIYKSTKIAYLT